MEKRVDAQHQWHQVIEELESEQWKLASYDRTILEMLGNVDGLKTLDYGSGPGILALALKRQKAESFAFDINPNMRAQCAEKIGDGHVIDSIERLRDDTFDLITCNLVLCIVDEGEVRTIASQIRRLLRPHGRAFIGFCNPLIFNVRESQLDFRFPTGDPYDLPHDYEKVKKEGGYRITEKHRPLWWYGRVFTEAQLTPTQTHFTPAYELHRERIRDFVIFEQTK